ncbi:glycosyltransferase family 2 protein [Kitasatospora sp. McL0602]|uniref:glycosyltransferase family 2 protein n=1 Tax=Kitasatospora sp. McL0602 TaxID=3439530 RepID=UPI003F88AD5B
MIVNWNTGELLRTCLRSIERTDRSVLDVHRVVVVDNASHDDSADTPTSLPLTTLRNRRNRGFAAACNQGAARSTADYLLFLNPDTELYPDTLRAVGDFLRGPAADGVGICGARVLDADGAPGISCSRFPTLAGYLGRTAGLDRALPTFFPPHHLRPTELRSSRRVDQVIGAFYLVRPQLFRELGGFDERYFLYLEEVDFALRARRLGWLSYFVAEARIRHIGNASSDQIRSRRLFYWLRSRRLYAARHWPPWQARLLTALSLTAEPAARLARAALRRSPTEARETVAGYGAYLRWLLHPARAGTIDALRSR